MVPVEMELLETRGRIAERPLAIRTNDGLPEKVRIDVRGQDRHLPVRQIGEELPQHDRQRIRLLAGATTGTPQAQPLLAAPPGAYQAGQHAVGEHLKRWLLPEEIGLPDREMTRQGLDLGRGERRG